MRSIFGFLTIGLFAIVAFALFLLARAALAQPADVLGYLVPAVLASLVIVGILKYR